MRKVPLTVQVGLEVVPPLVSPVTLPLGKPATDTEAFTPGVKVSSSTAQDGMVAVMTAFETLPPVFLTE